MECAKLGLVEVGLKTSLDNVERTCESRCGHTTESTSGQYPDKRNVSDGAYPPATKCAHGFDTGSFLVIGPPS